MKNAIVAFALLASTAALADQGQLMRAQPGTLEGFTSVACRDARPIADAGIMVAITQHGRTQFLEVSEQSFMGPRPVGTAPVRQIFTQARGNQAIYLGQGIQLVINMDSARRPDLLRTGEMEGFIRGVIGRARVDHDLRCQFFARAF